MMRKSLPRPAVNVQEKTPLPSKPSASRVQLLAIFLAFLRLGLTAFGGPTMVAYIRGLSVGKNRWLSEESFQNGVALC